MSYFAIRTNGDVALAVNGIRDRLEQKDQLEGLSQLPRLFITGSITMLKSLGDDSVYAVRVEYLFPQYHWYVVIVSFLLWVLFSWTALLVVSICFVLPSILWLGVFQYWLLKKGIQKQVPGARVTWLGGRKLCEALMRSE